jgi:hypothetical protein
MKLLEKARRRADESPAFRRPSLCAPLRRARRTSVAVNLYGRTTVGGRIFGTASTRMPSLVRIALAAIAHRCTGLQRPAQPLPAAPDAAAGKDVHVREQLSVHPAAHAGSWSRRRRTSCKTAARLLPITAQREGTRGADRGAGPREPPFASDNNVRPRPMPAGITGCVVNTDGTVGTLRVTGTCRRPVSIASLRLRGKRPAATAWKRWAPSTSKRGIGSGAA